MKGCGAMNLKNPPSRLHLLTVPQPSLKQYHQLETKEPMGTFHIETKAFLNENDGRLLAGRDWVGSQPCEPHTSWLEDQLPMCGRFYVHSRTEL